MTRIFYKIGIITLILFFESYTKNISFSADLTKLKIEILPIVSFIFAQREPMRVGWYNLPKSYKHNSSQDSNSKPVGSLFVQLPKLPNTERPVPQYTRSLQRSKNPCFKPMIQTEYPSYKTHYN